MCCVFGGRAWGGERDRKGGGAAHGDDETPNSTPHATPPHTQTSSTTQHAHTHTPTTQHTPTTHNKHTPTTQHHQRPPPTQHHQQTRTTQHHPHTRTTQHHPQTPTTTTHPTRKVYDEYMAHVMRYSDLIEKLPTRAFLAPLAEDEEVEIELAKVRVGGGWVGVVCVWVCGGCVGGCSLLSVALFVGGALDAARSTTSPPPPHSHKTHKKTPPQTQKNKKKPSL